MSQTNSRAEIFANIRCSLRRGKLDTQQRAALQQRLHPIQKNQSVDNLATHIAHFQQQLEKLAGSVQTVHSDVAVVQAIRTFLQQHNFPLTCVAAQHLRDLPWQADLQIEYRNATAHDRISITQGFAGIAETGSVMMLSSSDSPTPLNFLPEVHIVLLNAIDIVADLETAWAKLRMASGLPRTVNLISGPSRTADIEQTIQLGAHGPRAFHVILNLRT